MLSRRREGPGRSGCGGFAESGKEEQASLRTACSLRDKKEVGVNWETQEKEEHFKGREQSLQKAPRGMEKAWGHCVKVGLG